jgi:hypothetical protein
MKNKYIKKILIIFTILTVLIVLCGFWFFDHSLNEDRDYALNGEMLKLVKELDSYKKQHGQYPQSVLQIRSSDNLCVTYIYTKCQQVHYKPIKNFQDFRLAMKSFTWVILWYRHDACFDNSPSQDSNPIAVYFFCAASPEGKPHTFPEYRKDKKIFDTPSEWPVL